MDNNTFEKKSLVNSYFAAKPDKTGSAMFTSFDSKNGSAYLKLQKQTGWDTERHNGSFKGGESCNLKFTRDEIAGLKYIVEHPHKARVWTFYHQSRNQAGDQVVSSGSLSYLASEQEKGGRKTIRETFYLAVKVGKTQYKVGLGLGAAQSLVSWINFALDRMYAANYSAQKKEWEQLQKRQRETPKVEESTVLEETEEEFDPNEIESLPFDDEEVADIM